MSSSSAAKHSPESERLIIAAALDPARKALLDSLLGLISAGDFHNEQHGLTWSCIRMLHETSQPHDATALLDYTRKKNLFIGGVEYLAGMVEDPLAIAADDEAVLAAAHRLKEYAGFRALMATLQASVRMCESGESSLDGVLSFLEDAVQSTRKTVHTNRTGPRQMKEIIETVMVGMERQMDGEVTPATSTGFDDLDQICYGLQDEDFIVFGARPSMGKTASAINIAENVSDTGEKVLFFSLEMRDVA
jgi:replicative DNA helicase